MARQGMLRQLADGVALAAIIVLAWQALYEFAGESALTSPFDTVAHAASLIASPAFWPHVQETGLAVFQGLLIAVFGGLGIGLSLGVHRFSGTHGSAPHAAIAHARSQARITAPCPSSLQSAASVTAPRLAVETSRVYLASRPLV